MAQFQVFDSPIGNPDDDIFGMVAYADMLADFIGDVKPPYTIGIYGEWGEGKTSFVKLFKCYLEEKAAASKNNIKFITFSAWDHTTSDALWRALIIKIARELYEDKSITPQATTTQATTTPVNQSTAVAAESGFWNRISKFLAGDAYVFYQDPPPPDPDAEYKSKLVRIDNTVYGSISKSSEQQRAVNQEVAFMSVVNAAMSALSTISPLVAGVRGLLGLNSSINLSEMFAEKNEATRKMIETIGEFKQMFRDLFKDKVAEYRRVFVFVDDLDRCLPDVALDLLEAIKVFLEEVEFVFIVAADENLIGQGLKMRLKELFSGQNNVEAQNFFDQKGQEYFEKIIQFAVRVPPRTPEQTHTFIAAQFPKWTPATDIIQTAIGTNPRRLKQYCNLLTYKYMVGQIQSQTGTKDDRSLSVSQIQLLDKIITLGCRDRQYLDILSHLLNDPVTFKKAVDQIEKLLADAQEDVENPEAAKLLPDKDQLWLYQTAVKNAALLRLMQSLPNFSTAQPLEITTLSRIADARPHAGGSTISTSNSFFMRILSSVETITPRKLITDDFTKLIHFDHHYPEICQLLFTISEGEKWAAQMRAIESELAPQSINVASSTNLSPKANELRELLLEYQKSDDSMQQTGHKLFLNPPLFSTMLAEEVQLLGKVRDKLPAADSLLAKNLFESVTPIEKSHRIATATIELLTDDDKFKEIELSIALQLKVAFYFLELRKFAKVDAFNYKWRALAQQIRFGGVAALKALEAEAVKPVPSLEAVPESWRTYLRDSSLVRFLALRPLFKDFYKQDFEDYFAAAQAVKVEESAQPPVAAAAAKVAPAPPPLASVSVFDNLYLNISPVDPSDPESYQVSIITDHDSLPGQPFRITDVDFEELKVTLGESFHFRGLSEPASRQSGGVMQMGGMDFIERLTHTGGRLFNVVFSDKDARKYFIKCLKEVAHLRIVLEIKDRKLTALPWENLYCPELDIFPSLIKKYSLIRYFPNAVSLFPRTLTPPLRILVVVATPKDAPPLDVQQERDIMERTLATAVQNGQVQLEFTKNGTLEEVQRALRLFEPNLFHFVGHGVYTDEQKEGVLLFEDSETRSRVVEGSVLKNLLVDSNISLAVLNACDTGASGKLDAITSVAGTLVQNGIPAAVATMRNVFDAAALMFTREFYTSFVDGYTLEGALTESRKALSVEKQDWAAYALFTGTTNLDAFRLSSVQRQREK
jgi:KAP family P-loop domain/CHAT domain